MEWIWEPPSAGERIALLPGGFHPPTVAHMGLASAALGVVDRVVLTMPRRYPHKSIETVELQDRLRLLQRLVAGNSRFSVALSDGGLFVEMVRELRLARPETGAVAVLCGRDAAERMIGWDYGPDLSLASQLAEFSLLVADRDGTWQPPGELAGSVRRLETPGWDEISSTRVREAIAEGSGWQDLVPERIRDEVAAIYSPSRLDSRKVRNR